MKRKWGFKSASIFISLNAAFLVLVYFGTFQDVKGAANISIVLIHFFNVCTSITLAGCIIVAADIERTTKRDQEFLRKLQTKEWSPFWLSCFVDFAAIFAFAWHGWWLTTFAMVYQFGAVAMVRSFCDDFRKVIKEEAA